MYCGEANCYEVLGLDRYTFDVKDLKKAYRKASLKWHPDKNADNLAEATIKFQEITSAFETLNNPELVDAYNYFLDHPEMTMYNKMNFYRAAYKPTTPLSVVILGLLMFFSLIQWVSAREAAKTFIKSPMYLKLLEDEYLNNCTGGRHGYQSGELNATRKTEIREQFTKELEENPECPLFGARWSHTLLPNLAFRWPIAIVKWTKWRLENNGEIAEEKARAAKEEKDEAEQEQEEEEEREREAEAKEKKKAENAKHLEEKKRQEAEKKEKWAREAEEEAERKAAQEAKRSLIVEGLVVSVNEMRKKGHMLVEVSYEECGRDERAQMVLIDQEVKDGARVKIALEGAVPPGKKTAVKREKVAGEWSEGVLLEILPDRVEETSAAAEEAMTEEAEGQARQRKKEKTKGK